MKDETCVVLIALLCQSAWALLPPIQTDDQASVMRRIAGQAPSLDTAARKALAEKFSQGDTRSQLAARCPVTKNLSADELADRLVRQRGSERGSMNYRVYVDAGRGGPHR